MSSTAAVSEAVPVRYAREQYALGYAHGRAGTGLDGADGADRPDADGTAGSDRANGTDHAAGTGGPADPTRADAASFARFFVARCEDAGELVDVADAYRDWQAGVTAP